MKSKFLNFADEVRSSFWFLPALMVVGAIVLFWAMVYLDEVLDQPETGVRRWVYTGHAEGARALLSTIAGSMISVASVTFSITIVALTLTSSQFGPRLLRNFMRDTGNQLTLGTFIATFVYCLLILRTVRGGPAIVFIPHVSVTVALALALASIGVLIYFIHHVSVAIQANNVVAAVSAELDETINRLFPQPPKHEEDQTENSELALDLERDGQPVSCRQSGYIAAVDTETLLRLATAKNLVFRLEYRAGEFVAPGSPLVTVWPSNGIENALLNDIAGAFVLSGYGSPRHDVEFAIRQLEELAVRALSPGINDPYTAMACIDRLAVALAQIAERDTPPSKLYDSNKKLRVVTKRISFAGIVDAAFNQIRQYGRSSVAVTIRLLEAIAIVGRRARRDEDRRTLRDHAIMIERGAHGAGFDERDQKDIHERYQTALRILEAANTVAVPSSERF